MTEYNYTELFKRHIITDAISKSQKMNSQHYIIANEDFYLRDLGFGWSHIIELNLIDNRPSLSFTYQAKSKFHKERNIRLKKGDKVYFSDGNAPYLELEVIQPAHASKREDYRTVDFFLLEKDIETLINNKFEELVVVYKDGSPRTRIENVWYGCHGWKKAPQTKDNVFCIYVKAYKSALLEAEIISSSPKQKINNINFDPCYVYLMHDSKNGYHKIGISKTPKYREKTLQSEKPTIDLVCSKEYPSRKIAEAIESALHKVFEENRIRGEWFELSDADVTILKETLK